MSGEVVKDKYPKTPYLNWSPSKHREDRYHPDERHFGGREVVITEKLDGENFNILSDGSWHARSLDTPYHPTREWAGRVAGETGYKLPDGWRVAGENLYGRHSIKYTDLRSYVQVFAIFDEEDRILSWDDTVMWCELLDLQHVPVLWEGSLSFQAGRPMLHTEKRKIKLDKITEEDINQRARRTAEGYVMRVRESFPKEQFEYNIGKFVREGHIRTEVHWLRNWEKNGEKNEIQDA
jgi:hypothetical protein